MKLSKKTSLLKPSPTIAISTKAKLLKDAGHDVISLGFGEPDFNTPKSIINRTVQAMKDGKTKYTPADGIPELKEAVIEKYVKEQNIVFHRNEVIICTGAKYALYLLFQVMLDEGDEVIIPTPYWVSYPDQVQLAGGIPKFIECHEDNEFKLTIEQLDKVRTSKTKIIVLNSPSNPTGTIYNRKELKEIGDYCVKHQILIVYDEIYEKLIYTDDEHVCMSTLSEDIKNNTILINGVSKSHAMTGWRIGYAIGPQKIINAMADLASHTTSNPTSIAQYGALAAYEETEDEVKEMNEIFANRLNLFYNALLKVPYLICMKPKGAFYVFPNLKKVIEATGFTTVDEFVEALLEEEKLAIVPGSSFGSPNYARLSYATSSEQLIEAADRLNSFVVKNLK